MKYLADLHVHTDASDGTDTPAQAVERARRLGLRAIAVTDHDTVSGVPDAVKAGMEFGVDVVPGVELSVNCGGFEIHVLGYYLDITSDILRQVFTQVESERMERNEKIADLLEKAGYPISADELKSRRAGRVIARPHIAEMLYERGCVGSVKEAFDKLIGDGKPFCRPITHMDIKKAAELIKAAGGAAVLAHPIKYKKRGADIAHIVDIARDAGFAGIEVDYPKHTEEDKAYLRSIAERYGFIATGGSDYHGIYRPDVEMGDGNAPISILEKLRQAAER